MADREYVVPDGLVGERLDVGVARLTGLSRSKVQAMCEDGLISVNGRLGKASVKLAEHDEIAVNFPAPAAVVEVIAEPVPGMTVLYEDDDVIVVDKPVGVAAHPSPGWDGPTVIGGLAATGHRIATSGADERQGVVHRLDVGTTGVMVVAKSEAAYTSLKRQFKERSVEKVYHALVQGYLDPTSGTIDAPIGRHPKHDYKWAITADGKPSVTHYDTLEVFGSASLLEIHLETGRTHQIRVHMAAMKHPCVGDVMYGADPKKAGELGLSRQWLHARELSFDHPMSGERMTFTSPYPSDLADSLALVAGND